MANVDNPHGLQPLMRSIEGGEVQVARFLKGAAVSGAIFINDVVARNADGNLAAGGTPGTTTYDGVSLNRGATLTETWHDVIVTPKAVYEAQDNNDTNGFDFADQGLNVNIEFNAGNATTGISGHELDESTVATTASLDVHLLRLHRVPTNAYGAFGRWEVVFNKHRMSSNAAGV